jgi:hypothetical protein
MLLVEQDYEPTLPLCCCDHVISNATSYFAKPLSWQPLLFQISWLYPKTKSQVIFWYKGFPNYLFTKLMGIYKLVWSHYFIKLLFYKPFIIWFQTPLKKFDKGDACVSNSFWKYLQKLYSLIWNSFQLHHGTIIIERLFFPCSTGAWLVANVWLCEMSWPCMTMLDFVWVLECSYDLQVGMWPNLSKTHQFI